MKINKVLILGIDALEYDLIEEWDLKNPKLIDLRWIIEEMLKNENKEIFDINPYLSAENL